MSKQYCFSIINPQQQLYIEEDLENFVKNLYVGEDKFETVDQLPFLVISSEDKICILIKGRSKKNLEKIENIHNSFKKSDLSFNSNIKLKNPVLFDIQAVQWWNNDGGEQKQRDNKNQKWNSLSHKGPYFTHIMEPYVPLGATIKYDGVDYPLNPEEEEVASFYAKRIISERKGDIVEQLTKDKVFNTNFFNDFKTYLSVRHKGIFKTFSKFDWSNLIEAIEERKNQITDEQKMKNKIKLEKKKHKYGIAIIDGNEEKVGNFVVEPSAIFYGRGKNPNRGKIKKNIDPEDVIINIGENDPIPKPPPGHNWKEVVHDNSAIWLSKWTDSITGNTKYVLFSMEGKFKGENDMEKYEKARKLQRFIDVVRNQYMDDVNSDNQIKKQLGTILWFIDNHGIRVGNEKGEDEADTVGASTLRVEHIKFSEGHIIFDFLGKDSIKFYKKIKVPKNIFNNLKLFVRGKNKDEQIFDKVNSSTINSYLKTFDKCFSAKVFRTRLASTIMFNGLKRVSIPKGSTKIAIKKSFNKANSEVAELLNHTRNVSQKAKDAVQKEVDKVKQLESELEDTVNDNARNKIETQIQKLKDKIEAKTDVLKVAITTSLNNYIDPRLVVAWSKTNDVEVNVIYTQTLMKKFNWAISTTDKNWNYLESPLIGNQDLEPALKIPVYKPIDDTDERKESPTPIISHIDLEEDTRIQSPKIILPNFKKMNISQLKEQAKIYNCKIFDYL